MNQVTPPTGGYPPVAAPDPEANGRPVRRRYPVEYKVRVLQEADACTKTGELGGLLRREGLYSSLLASWRRQREEGILQGLAPRKRGRKPKECNPLASRVAQLEHEKQRLETRLRQAEAIVEIQKKACELLGIPSAKGPRRNGRRG